MLQQTLSQLTTDQLLVLIESEQGSGKNNLFLGQLYFRVGMAYQKDTLYRKAIDAFNLSLDSYQLEKSTDDTVALVNLQLGRTYSMSNNWEKSFKCLEISQSLLEHKSTQYTRELVDVCNLLGVCQMRRGRIQSAREYYESAIERTFKANFDKTNQTKARLYKVCLINPLSNLSLLNWLSMEYEDAMSGYRSVQKLQQELGLDTSETKRRMAMLQLSTGRQYQGLKEISKICDTLLIQGKQNMEYKDFCEKVFPNILKAIKDAIVHDEIRLILTILERHFEGEDLLIDYVKKKLGNNQQKKSKLDELD